MNEPELPQFLADNRIVPVIVIEDIDDAIPLCRALVEGGITALEITLRTECALAAIERVAAEVEGATVGAGTVANVADLEAALAAGAEFIVSPGNTPALLERARALGTTLLPGAVTASEVMQVMEYGFPICKFFPASTSGGAAAIKAFAGPFGSMRFIPTGGVSPHNLGEYLSLPNVVAAGGSWMLPGNLVAGKAWATIAHQARDAVTLAREYD